jgi:hypothetical protein
MNSQVARRREANPNHWIQAMGESLDQNLHKVSRIGGLGVERISFQLRSRKVPSAEGSYKHIAHPLGGGHVVDRWHSNKCLEKGGSG